MNDPLAAGADGVSVAEAVRARRISAAEVVELTFERIARLQPTINAFTLLTQKRAREQARSVDDALGRGDDAAPLAGVPYAVKAMIDLRGFTTTAGSRVHVGSPPASRDAACVSALSTAGAICVGAVNMDEFGLGGTTENALFGATRNPHDPTRTPGGSSGGSAAAVAAGMVPFSIGSDGLGSVRLPAALCGVFGLRPTRGRFPRQGTLGAGGTISTLGPLARSVRDLALICDAVVGNVDGPGSLADIGRRDADIRGLRIAVADGYFAQNLDDDAAAAIATVTQALGVTTRVDYPEATLARAAAVLVHAAESGHFQLDQVRRRPEDLDPRTRDRFFANALMPASWYLRAQKFRAWHRQQLLRLLRTVDVLLFPATPCAAPRLGTATILINGVEQSTGPSLGFFTQPLAPTDLPVLTVPMLRPAQLPIGVQLLAAPDREDQLLRVAAFLEHQGVAGAPIARV